MRNASRTAEVDCTWEPYDAWGTAGSYAVDASLEAGTVDGEWWIRGAGDGVGRTILASCDSL